MADSAPKSSRVVRLNAVRRCGWSNTDGQSLSCSLSLLTQALLVAGVRGSGRFDPGLYRFWVCHVGGAGFFLFFSRRVMRWSSARYWRFCLGLLSYRSWWGLFPVAPAKPMVAGSVIGTAIGVWFLASLSVAEFQLWIGVSVVIASVVLARFVPSERAASSPAAAGNRCGVGPDERCIRYSRAAGHSLCGRDPFRAREVPGLPYDVLLVLERGVTGHVRCGRAGFSPTFSIVVGCSASNVAGQSGWELGISPVMPARPIDLLSWGCAF